MKLRKRFPLMQQAEAVDTTAAPAPAAPAPAPEPAPAPASSADNASLLKPPPAPAPAPAQGTAVDDLGWLPEKFRVNGADGKVDLSASSKKLGESYTNLEKVKGHTPPPTASDYTFTPPEEFKDAVFDDALSAGFRERAHKAGISQAQYEFVMGEYLSLVPQVLDATLKLSIEEARQELSKVWQSSAVFEAQLNNAQRAVDSAPESIRKDLWDRFGRDPAFLQFAAFVGQEMREDTSPVNADGGTGGGGQTMEQMMAHPAYRDPKHPEHAAVSARVMAAAKRLHGG